ncbi:hypothetical protein YC2023_010334 [Brassica napus]
MTTDDARAQTTTDRERCEGADDGRQYGAETETTDGDKKTTAQLRRRRRQNLQKKFKMQWKTDIVLHVDVVSKEFAFEKNQKYKEGKSVLERPNRYNTMAQRLQNMVPFSRVLKFDSQDLKNFSNTRFEAQMGTTWITLEDEAGESDTDDQMITILIAQEDEAGESTRFGAQMGTIWITQEDEAGESDTDD